MEVFSQMPPWVLALMATGFTYIMTAVGAAVVFLTNKFNKTVLTVMTGFAAGIMIAASFFSLLLPAKEQAESEGSFAWLILTFGFLAGGVFVALTDFILGKTAFFREDQTKKSGFLTWVAMTMHNIPEGLAVGVAFGSLVGGEGTIISAMMLALGIGIQNFPEGLCASIPLKNRGMSSGKAFFFGQVSGFVEVPSGVLGALAVGVIASLLPWALSFSAGAMIAVACAELIPSAYENGKISATSGILIGFGLMTFLDVLLG